MTDVTTAGDWRDYLALSDEGLLAQCELDRFRASGPGGQKRNKTESAVRLRHRPTGLHGEAVEERSQHLNRARALRRLRQSIALTLRAPIELDGYANEGALAEAVRANGRIEMGRRDARYLEVVARLFDVLEAAGWRVSDAAPHLGVSTAQVSRFLANDDVILRAANERRQALGLSPLRAAK
jgi:hypothetical protein